MSNYVVQPPFFLPGPNTNGIFDELPDGRLIVWDGENIQLEVSTSSRTFSLLGQVAQNAAPYPSFIRVSPGGDYIAVGDSTDVTFFPFNDLTQRFKINTGNNYDAEWVDNTKLAISGIENGESVVSVIDYVAQTNTVMIRGINGASAGVTIDAAENLYCANGWADVEVQTGNIKAFAPEIWKPVLSGAAPLDFKTNGILVADLLSAATLGFDKPGNMHVGGGDGQSTDKGYAAVVSAGAVAASLAGGPPVTAASPASDLQRLDPDPKINFWYVNSNWATGELYLKDYGTLQVYPFTR